MNTTQIQFSSNRVRDVERQFLTALSDIYPEGEIRQMTRMLFEAYLGWNTTTLLLNRESTINQSDLLKFHWAIEDLKKQRPIQHIIGYTDFCDCRINVSEHTLIPRPETEEIVQWIASNIVSPTRVVDLCTGSGCIAIALKKQFPQAMVSAVDVSEEALKVARENASQNVVEVEFCQADILAENGWQIPKDTSLIVSNPPYIKQSESVIMSRNVLDYEPHLALFVSDSDPLLFYRRIARMAKEALAEGGKLVLEINENLGRETQSMLAEEGYDSHLHQDFRGKDRMVEAWKA